VTITDHRVERYADVDLYSVLHITADASADFIERAYKWRVTEVHPDRAGEASTERAALVNAAGEILRDPSLRARYDSLPAARRASVATMQTAERKNGEEQGRQQELEAQLATARWQLAAAQVELGVIEAAGGNLLSNCGRRRAERGKSRHGADGRVARWGSFSEPCR
jgi:curved DNA-binding protein CbpA